MFEYLILWKQQFYLFENYFCCLYIYLPYCMVNISRAGGLRTRVLPPGTCLAHDRCSINIWDANQHMFKAVWTNHPFSSEMQKNSSLQITIWVVRYKWYTFAVSYTFVKYNWKHKQMIIMVACGEYNWIAGGQGWKHFQLYCLLYFLNHVTFWTIDSKQLN